MIRIEINNVTAKLSGEISDVNFQKLSDLMSYKHPGYQFMSGGRGGYKLGGAIGGWDGAVRLLTKGGSFPVGLVQMAKNFFKENNIEFEVADKRPALKYGKKLELDETKFKIRDYQQAAITAADTYGSGIIRMATGCHTAGTKVIMADGSRKVVEDIKVGDILMGPDSKPRVVTELCRGKDKMYNIIPDTGDSFGVNAEHIMTFKKGNSSTLIDIKFSDYLRLAKKNEYRLVRAIPALKHVQTDLNLYNYGSKLFVDDSIGLLPEVLEFSLTQKLQVIAGLIDTYGAVDKNGEYRIILNKLESVKYVLQLFRSCGFSTKHMLKGGNTYIYISGMVSKIPVRKESKSMSVGYDNKNSLRTSFKYEELGWGSYYGFKIDGDHRYLLDDYTITHNSGKTLTIASLVAHYNIPTIIYVIGIELLFQMKETIEAAYGVKVGLVGGGQFDPDHNIVIMTIWSAAAAYDKKAIIDENDSTSDNVKDMKDDVKKKIRNKVETAQLFIFDECQYAASETLQFLHKASIAAKHRFLFSGTPWRDTGDDILIEAVGGKKIYDLPATELINRGFLVTPEIHFFQVPVMRNVGTAYQSVYTKYIVENDERNELICKAAKNLVKSGKRVLILVVRVPHGKAIMDALGDDYTVKFLDGAKSTKARMDTIKEMKDGKIDILIASKIFDQGVDIPELDALILAGSGKSSGRALQRIGRVIRLYKGKKKAIVVDFFDNCKYLRDHSEARIKIYQSEPGFEIVMQEAKPTTYPKRKDVSWV